MSSETAAFQRQIKPETESGSLGLQKRLCLVVVLLSGKKAGRRNALPLLRCAAEEKNKSNCKNDQKGTGYHEHKAHLVN